MPNLQCTLPFAWKALQSTSCLAASKVCTAFTLHVHNAATSAITCRDFGVLSDSDERCYITAMAACGQAISSAGSSRDAAAGATCCSLLDQQLLVNLLCTSQQFIRSCGQEWDVSLRDVKRCIKLARYGAVV